MPRKQPKTAVVAFKVEEELAEFLNKLPNKSAFIRKAIAAQLGMACPLCNGKGVVPRGVHDHYAPLLRKMNRSHCEDCGDALALPHDPGDLDQEDDSIDVDFTEAKLAGCDLRASLYESVKLVNADLQNADLRRATFQDCDFAGAILRGAKLSKNAKILESLSAHQSQGIDYQPQGE